MMTFKMKKILMAAALMVGFSSAQAAEISGTIDFNAVGEIIDSTVTGQAAAYNSFDNEACPYAPFGNCATTFAGASGNIWDLIVAGGGPVTMYMPDDFTFVPTGDLEAAAGAPAYKMVPGAPEVVEWILGPVYDSIAGVGGELHFIITGGGAADVSGNGNLDDLAGTGVFKFVEEAGAVVESVYEDTLGFWALTNSGGVSISGSNVPTPAVLGLFGLGLVGLGMIRRRRETH